VGRRRRNARNAIAFRDASTNLAASCASGAVAPMTDTRRAGVSSGNTAGVAARGFARALGASARAARLLCVEKAWRFSDLPIKSQNRPTP